MNLLSICAAVKNSARNMQFKYLIGFVLGQTNKSMNNTLDFYSYT